MKHSGIAVAIVGAGVAIGLSACGPNTLAGHMSKPSGPPGKSMPAGAGSSPGAGSSRGTGNTAGTDGQPGTMTSSGNASGSYQFRTIGDPADPAFNQLLGISNRDNIVGYFGSGAAGHPNKGYQLTRTPAGFRGVNENVPGAVQTQVIGVNDHGVSVGFWSHTDHGQNDDNVGFYNGGNQTRSVRFPTADNSSPPVNQLLGVNDENVTVGFYNDAHGNAHAYTYSIVGGRFRPVLVPGAASTTAAGISNRGDVAGFFANSAGATDGFLRTGADRVFTLAYPGASMTQATGVNDLQEVVGNYQVGTGNNAVTHGFTWTPGRGFKSVDDPQGAGSTVINGVNDAGAIVGFYTDRAGNTDGFAAAPAGQAPFPGLTGIPMLHPSPSSSTMPSTSPGAMPSASMGGRPSMMPTTRTGASKTMAPKTTPPSKLQPTHF